MKQAILWSLTSLALLAWPAAAATTNTPISALPGTNTLRTTDRVLVNADVGGGAFATRTIAVSDLVAGMTGITTNQVDATFRSKLVDSSTFTRAALAQTNASKFAGKIGQLLPSNYYADVQPTPLLMYGSWYDSMEQAEGGWSATEDWIIGTAQWWSTNGYKAAGWQWIRIDDPWMAASWGPNGELVADPTRFPNGIAYTVQKIHEAGFKACGYTSFGANSCYGLPATPEDKVFQHVQQFVDWGFDGLMIDLCTGIDGEADTWHRKKFALFGQAVAATGKKLMLLNNVSVYPAPVYAPYQSAMVNIWDPANWFIDVCNDALNSSGAWASNYYGLCTFLDHYDKGMGWMTRPGCSINYGAPYWNNRPSTHRAVHGLYAILGAGIMTGGTYTRRAWHYDSANPSYAPPWMTGTSFDQVYYQTNREWAAIHQDPAVVPGHLRSSNDWCEVWTRPLGSVRSTTNAAFLVNMATNGTKDITLNWSTLGVPDDTYLAVRDVFAQTNVGIFRTNWTYSMPQTNCGLFRLEPAKEIVYVPAGAVQLNDGKVGAGLDKLHTGWYSPSPVLATSGWRIIGSEGAAPLTVNPPQWASMVLLEGTVQVTNATPNYWTNEYWNNYLSATDGRRVSYTMIGQRLGTESAGLANYSQLFHFPTNAAIKNLVMQPGVATNSAYRFYLAPLKMICW